MIRNYLFIFVYVCILLNAFYSNGGPASPIEWMMDNIEYITTEKTRDKLLLGVSMYAMSYLHTRAPEPLVMKTVVEKLSDQIVDEELLTEKEELNWDSESQEAWFVDIDEDGTRQGVVWVPTIRVSSLSPPLN